MNSVAHQAGELLSHYVGEKNVALVLYSLKAAVSEFTRPAVIVTSEDKYHYHGAVAEFWCTVSSPALALPVLLFLVSTTKDVEPTVELAIYMSGLTALVSAVYHAMNWEGLSVIDCGFALSTYVLCVLNTMGSVFGSEWQDWNFHLTVLSVIAALYIGLYRFVDVLTPIIFGVISPVAVYVLVHRELWFAIVSLGVASLCFILDRHKLCKSHTMWHIFCGISLYITLYDTLEL